MTLKRKVLILSVSSFLVLVSVISSFFILLNIAKKEKIQAATTYNIGTLEELKNFIDKVFNYESSINAVLTNNIDCKGETILPIGTAEGREFSGSFNGAGFKIFNFSTNRNFKVENPTYITQGFFAYTKGATIKNLRLTKFTHDFRGDSSKHTGFVGGLVGYAEDTTISNCQVDNFTIKTEMNSRSVAGIVGGAQDTTVSNCSVNNFNHEGYCGNITSSYFVSISGLVANIWGSGVLQLCVFDPYQSVWKLNYATSSAGYAEKTIMSDSTIQFSDNYVNGDMLTFDDDKKHNCYYNTGMHGFRALSKSHEGGKTLKDSYGSDIPWYHVFNYSDFPALRMFMDWRTWIVKASDPNAGTLTGDTKIVLPSDYTVKISNSDSKSISIRGYSLYYELTNEKYNFIGWTVDTTNSIIMVNVKYIYKKVVFKVASQGKINVTQLEYEIERNEDVTYKISSDKSKIEYVFNYKGSKIKVEYTAINKIYYCSNRGMESKTTNDITTITIKPTFILKEYNIIFGAN